MRRLRWGAAVLAAAIVIPFCTHFQHAVEVAPSAPRAHDRPLPPPPVAPTTSAPAAALEAEGVPAVRSSAGRAATGGRSSGEGEGEPGALPAALPPPTSASWAQGKFSDFSPEELADMAERCELRWQLPPFAAGGASGNGDAYDRALARERDRYTAAVRALYVEMTGDSAGAAQMSLRALAEAIRGEPDDDAIATHRRLAAARAGDASEPSGSVYERYLALQLGAGEAFERALAADVGSARAHELRLAAGPKFTLTGCDPQSALFRSQR